MADDELEQDRKELPLPPGMVREAFTPSAYNLNVPLHRIAVAGLTAMNRHPDFDPESTRAIILLHDGDLATVAPLNYPNEDEPAPAQSAVVIADLLQHANRLAENLGIRLVIRTESPNGEKHDH